MCKQAICLYLGLDLSMKVQLVRVFALVCLVFVCVSVCFTPSQQASYAASSPASDEILLVSIKAPHRQSDRSIVDLGLDLLPSQDGGSFSALVSPQELARLRSQGWQVEVDPFQSRLLSDQRAFFETTNAFSLAQSQRGYRSVRETERYLFELASRYPDLVRLEDIGDSWLKEQTQGEKGYDIWAIRLSNRAISGPKPVFLMVAALHAREIVTSELATRYIDFLLEGYGRSAMATWLLDEYEVVVIPISNPDGRELVEQGYYQRKNVNNSAGECFGITVNYHNGVDLNRNFAFDWGTITQPTLSFCSEVFPGQDPASEPETRALQDFIDRLFAPSLAADALGDPQARSGMLISLHSYANMILWPWGSSPEPPLHGTALRELGLKMASYNGYLAQQAYQLYPISGSLEDWFYANYGVASFTFEVGPSYGARCSGFFPAYSCLDGELLGSFWPQNLPAFIYANQVARAPYQQVYGPTVEKIRIEAGEEEVQIRVWLQSPNTPIRSAELYIDYAAWQSGLAWPLHPVDGNFDSPYEEAIITLDRSMFDTQRLLLIRAKNSTWGPVAPFWSTEQAQYSSYLPLVKR